MIESPRDTPPVPTTDTPLLIVLRQRALLSAEEEALLRSPDVLALPPRAQLDYLNSNRRVGRAVTIFAGGLRLALIAGALLTHMGLVISGALPFAWWWSFVWVVLAGVLAWLVPPFLRRVGSLSRRLPGYDELGRPGEQ
jgi:hypothetical protein